MRNGVLKSQKGFTLIELLAVMAIIGILASIIVPAVSGTGESSRDAQTQQDGSSIDSAAGDFFADQTGAEVLTSKTVTVTATINGSAASAKTQQVSSRWPELFITNGTTTAAYRDEFPTISSVTNGVVTSVIITDLDGAVVSRATLLEDFTAIDFDTLVANGFLQKTPESAESLSGDQFHNYLWLFQKQTSAGGSGENDSRKVAVFRLASVEITGDTSAGSTLPSSIANKTVELTFDQIF